MRRGISPKYDLLQIEGAVHEPTFVYRVTVGECTASGSGQSKKKAKHCAAKAVLDIIIRGGGSQANGTDGLKLEQNNDLSSVVSPYDDGIPGNPVGQLQELCMNRRWPPPTYELESENGSPHERIFSLACTIATYKEIGQGKSKKVAKRQAAYAMMQKLSYIPADQKVEGIDDEEDLATKLSQRYAGIKDYKVSSLSAGDSRKVSQFHSMLKKRPGPKVQDLQKNSLSAHGLDFKQMLVEVATEAKFDTTYFDIEEISHIGECQCLLQLATLPVAVCYGTGATKEDAQAAAAHNALEYLTIMTKPKK